jgi:hypothetical protein
MTDEELKVIRERCEKATPGPWRADGRYIETIEGAEEEMAIYDEGGHDELDAEFIAHAREDVPRLLEEIERLREGLKKLQWCGWFVDKDYHWMTSGCPACRSTGMNHAEDCWLAELLK